MEEKEYIIDDDLEEVVKKLMNKMKSQRMKLK